MKLYTVHTYKKDHYQIWNDFIKDSKNGTFLFHRDFIEYHADRFQDFSLMIYQENKLIALFPANISKQEVYSHQGLTYGGLILRKSIGGEKIKNILNTLVKYLSSLHISMLYIKNQPVFYHKRPSNESSFFFSELGAACYRRDLNLAIDYNLPLNFHRTKYRHFEKNEQLGFEIQEINDFSLFWNQVLIPRLEKKHDVKPVHTLKEIQLLKNKFPDYIKQFVIYLDGKIMAGITIFKTDTVVKSQYGAVTAEGEKRRALDFLFITLIQKYKEEGYRFFDMGTVTENNYGLLKQKEELGCEIYTQDFYKLDLTSITQD